MSYIEYIQKKRHPLDNTVLFAVGDRVRVVPDYPGSWRNMEGCVTEVHRRGRPPGYTVEFAPFCDPIFESKDLIGLDYEAYVRDCF